MTTRWLSRIVALTTVFLLTILSRGSCQSVGGEPSYYLALPLFDLGVNTTWTSGIIIAVAPGWQSVQGQEEIQEVMLNFHPDSVAGWLDQAGAVLRVAAPIGSEPSIQWVRPLRAYGSPGYIQVGRSRKGGKLTKSLWFVIGDSVRVWRIELTADQADSALRLIKLAAEQSLVELTTKTDTHSSAKLSSYTQATVINQPALRQVGAFGHVIVQFIVGVDGRVEPMSVRALLASDPRLAAEAREVLLGSTFRAATVNGEPIREMLHQRLNWRIGPPPN
jgi:hypothetical protein